MRNVHSCENKKGRGRKWKKPVAADADETPKISSVVFPSAKRKPRTQRRFFQRNRSYRAVNMKAISPVRSFRKSSATVTEHSLGISRSKTPVDDPLSLLYNMNDCYSKLKELVPSIPQNKNVSKMEILQHVIDYILDLQIALDSNSAITSLHHPRAGQGTSRTPLTTLNTDISILSLQTPEFQSDLITEDSRTLYR
ncbi:DNA-binding protein inhibitor ID-2a [Pseudorasbora parva]